MSSIGSVAHATPTAGIKRGREEDGETLWQSEAPFGKRSRPTLAGHDSVINTPTQTATHHPKYDSDDQSSMVSEPGSPQEMISSGDDDMEMDDVANYSRSPDEYQHLPRAPQPASPWARRVQNTSSGHRVATPFAYANTGRVSANAITIRQHKTRVIPFHMQARKAGNLSPEYANYRVGKFGVQHVISRTFNQMLQDGVLANEETYRIIMTAAAREGEIGIVKTVLRKVWGVDVDAIMEGATNGEALVPIQMSADSDIYPTDQLLFTIAHAFSINNNIPAALRVVDFIARHYHLAIPHETWAQLFEWTFVLAMPRSGGSRVNRQGQVPLQSLLDLWNTMTGEPYCVQPTMGMYSLLIKNLHKRHLTPLMIEKMEEGLQLHLTHIAKCKSLWQQLKCQAHVLRTKRPPPPDATASLNRLRQAHDHAELLRQRNRFWLKRWVRLLLATLRPRAISFDRLGDLALRRIPSLLWRFEAWVPSTVRYDTVGGLVEIKWRSEEVIAAFHRDLLGMARKREALLRPAPRLVGGAWMRRLRPRATRRLRRRVLVEGDVARGGDGVAGSSRDQSEGSGGEEGGRTEGGAGKRGGDEW